MAYFQYIARTKSGEKQEGRLEAADRSLALIRLEQMGLFPISIKEATGMKSGPKAKTASFKGHQFKLHMPARKHRMPMRLVLLFSRELSDLLSSGMKLGSALHTLASRDSGPAQNEIAKHLRDEVVQGVALSDALMAYPETFPPLFQNMIKAGEAIGSLPETLNSLCDHYERVQAAKEKVLMALLYPGIVLGACAVTLVAMSTFVIPRFSKVFEDLGGTLPAPTKMLIQSSEFMQQHGILALILLAGICYAARRALKTEKGKLWWHERQLKLPALKGVVTANAFANFSRTLETLIRNGVPILQALSIVENTVTNVVIANALAVARERVTDGSSISGPLASANVFPQTLTDMLAVGEESGDLPGALSHISRRYEQELDRNVKIFTTVLEPFMILFVAILIGFVAVSLMLPVFDMTSGLQL
ncbi:type II secretion system F family protein [Verrucomicrobiota bacterium]